jgi:hypothetical protein
MIGHDEKGLMVGTVLFAAVGLIFCIYQAYRSFAKGKRIKNSPTSDIGELTEGTRRIKGTITERGEKFRAPMTGRPCVYYEFMVSQQTQNGAEAIIHDKTIAHCHVDDGTGVASINLDGAELVLDNELHESSGRRNPASPRLEALLKRFGKSSKRLWFNLDLLYTETILEVGDELCILGQAKVVKGNVWFKASSGQPLIVSDKSARMLLENSTDTAVRYAWWAFAWLFFLGLAICWVLNPMDDSRPETSVKTSFETKYDESLRASKTLIDDVNLLLKKHEERRRPVKSTPNDFHLLKK